MQADHGITIPHIKSKSKPLDVAFVPPSPLPLDGSFYVVGQPGSGKTSLILSLLKSHPTRAHPERPKFFYGYFNRIHIVSPSHTTLPDLDLPPEQIHEQFSDQGVQGIINELHAQTNGNDLLWLDDCITDISSSPPSLQRAILNRRHVTCNEGPGTSSLSVIVTSQHYKALHPKLRSNFSHLILFPTQNASVLKTIRDEVMSDLSDHDSKRLLRFAWTATPASPRPFLLVCLAKCRGDGRYYKSFNKITF